MKKTLLVLLAVGLAGCADDLVPGGKVGGADGGSDGGTGPRVVSQAVAADVTETVVNATASDAWVYFDFETGTEVEESNAAWDVAFQRYRVESNGGFSGTGGAEVAVVEAATLADLTHAPTTGWVVDLPDGDDDNMDLDSGFNAEPGWYDYDPSDHKLTARPQSYVVLTGKGGFFALQLLGYYDAAGTPGNVKLQWKPVSPPDGTRVPATPYAPLDGGAPAEVDGGIDAGAPEPDAAPVADDAGTGPLTSVAASSSGTWTYLQASGQVVTPAGDPAAATDWDLAFSRTLIRTNSGTSGLGMGGARLADPGATFDQVTAAPADGYEVDAVVPAAGPTGMEHSGNGTLEAWYDYDPATHGVSPKAVVFILKTAAGGHAKVQIASYKDGVFQLRLAGLP